VAPQELAGPARDYYAFFVTPGRGDQSFWDVLTVLSREPESMAIALTATTTKPLNIEVDLCVGAA
jgi:hypothetical protein